MQDVNGIGRCATHINNQVFVKVSNTYWIHSVRLSNKCKESHYQFFSFVVIVCYIIVAYKVGSTNACQ